MPRRIDKLCWHQRSLRWFAFGLSIVTVATLLYGMRVPLAESLLPVFGWFIQLVEWRFDGMEFSIIRSHGEYVFHLRMMSSVPVSFYGQRFPGMDISATTLVTYALQHVFIMATVLIGGLLLTPARPLMLIALSFASLLLSLLCDIPWVLLGSIDGLLLEVIAPDRLNIAPTVLWEKFINSGGRMAIAINFGLLSLVLAQQNRKWHWRTAKTVDS